MNEQMCLPLAFVWGLQAAHAFCRSSCKDWLAASGPRPMTAACMDVSNVDAAREVFEVSRMRVSESARSGEMGQARG